jgi:hypothetical protein
MLLDFLGWLNGGGGGALISLSKNTRSGNRESPAYAHLSMVNAA